MSAITSDRRSLTSCVPRMTPQSINIFQGLWSCFGNVTRKQSPNPCRYIRTEARAAACTAAATSLFDPWVADFAVDAGRLLCAILRPPSGSMQHGKGLVDPVVVIRTTGGHCRYVVLQ